MIIERPACPSVEVVKCQRCHDCGMLYCFQEEYGVGHYWAFCDCEAGKKEEERQHQLVERAHDSEATELQVDTPTSPIPTGDVQSGSEGGNE